MRKFIVLFGLLLLWLYCYGQSLETADIRYEHPFKQGDDIWNKYSSARERILALQIPNDILPKIPTNNLLKICLDFPYLTDMFAYNSQKEGFDALVDEYNGFKDLLKRKDLIAALLDEFEMIPNKIHKIVFAEEKEKGDYSFKYYVLTYLLKRAIIDLGVNNDQKERISESILVNKEITLKYPEIFGKLCVNAVNSLEKAINSTNTRATTSLVVGQTVQIHDHDYIVSKRQTPRGSDVWVEVLDDDDYTSSQKMNLMYNVINNYGADFLSEATYSYNCHSYAWHMTEGNSNDHVWLGYYSTDEDVYWDDGSYYEVPESLATKVRYTNEHSAVRLSNNLYVSKWGPWPLVAHTPNNVPSGYGVPYKYYKRTPPITGPFIICSTATYYIDDLPAGYSVTWSFKNASSLNNLIQQNSPSANQCTITPGSTNIDHTLVATIWKNNTDLVTIEKDIMTPKSLTGTIHQEGQYYYGRNYPSFTIGMESIFAVNQVCQITLQSPKFKHMNFSTTTNPNATVNLQRIDDETIRFCVPLTTTDVDLRIYGTGNGSCNDFELRVLAMKNPIDPSNPFYINMSGNTIELELNQAMIRNLNDGNIENYNNIQQPWMLNVYEATTARKVYSEQIEGNSQNIDVSGWNAGIYIIYAVINGKTYSTKVTVK